MSGQARSGLTWVKLEHVLLHKWSCLDKIYLEGFLSRPLVLFIHLSHYQTWRFFLSWFSGPVIDLDSCFVKGNGFLPGKEILETKSSNQIFISNISYEFIMQPRGFISTKHNGEKSMLTQNRYHTLYTVESKIPTKATVSLRLGQTLGTPLQAGKSSEWYMAQARLGSDLQGKYRI